LTFVLFSAQVLVAQSAGGMKPEFQAEPTSEPIVETFGTGSFNLMKPTVGLSSLSSYKATLTVSFKGTQAGQAVQWSRTYTLLATQSPSARQLTLVNSDSPQLYMALVDNTIYERHEGENCGISTAEPDDTLAAKWEPAGMLDSVIGADEAGTETVNKVAAKHYTFDERAQGASEIADSTGELWVASDGGYLVRYLLTTMAKANYFGAGIEGALTWDYELQDVNQPQAIQLPDDCPSGVLDVPMLPDASDITNVPGFISFTTASSLADAAAFYAEQVAALGGQTVNPPVISETMALVGYTQGEKSILVTITKGETGTQVDVYGLKDASELAIAKEAPQTATTQTPSGDCTSTASLSLLPDATNVQQMPNTIMYTTSTKIADAIAFYQDQFKALGAQVSSPMPATNMMGMLQATQGGQITAITIVSAGGTSRVTIAYTGINPVALGDCVPTTAP
jgi:hypothetical protein